MVLAAKARGQEVQALFEQASAVLVANVAVGAVVAGTLWSTGDTRHILWWLSAVLTLTVARSWQQRRDRELAPGTADLAKWGRRFVWSSACSGLLWGAAGFGLFQSGNLVSQVLLTLAIGGMTAAASGSLSCHLPAFFAFFFCALGPLAARMFVEGGQLHTGIGAMLVAYGVGMVHVARSNHRSFARAFQLGLENAELVERLSRSQQELERRVVERTAQLEQRSEALRRAQRLEVVGKLAGSLAHDFNNLLTVVLSNAALLKDGKTGDENRSAAADETLEAARRGAGLIRQLLSLTHRQRTEPQAFSVNSLVLDSEATLRRLAGDSVETRLELGPEPSFVHADPAQMEQVLLNLASAACAAMPHGGKLRIGTDTTDPACVVLSVEDDGDGGTSVDAAAPTSVDGAFDHLPSSAAEAFDRSLGLAVARAIIEESGGRFLVDSGASQGTHFRVELPASSKAPSVAPLSSHATRSVPGATVLVVDDEATLRSVIRRTLTREGYRVLVAEDGERALACARSHPSTIDLLVTDVVMPGLSGPELARKLLLERPEMRVLFISGYSFEEIIPTTDSGEGTSYLAKPFDSASLIAKVRQLLTTVVERSGVRDVG